MTNVIEGAVFVALCALGLLATVLFSPDLIQPTA